MARQRRLLIDGDIVCYRCSAAAQKTIYEVAHAEDPFPIATFTSSAAKGEGFTGAQDKVRELQAAWPGESFKIRRSVEAEPLRHCLYTIRRHLELVENRLGSNNFEIYISPPFCFRDELATITSYKGNRIDQEKPVHLEAAKRYLQESFKAKEAGGLLEADDRLSIEGWADPEAVVVSIDKDLDQIPGRHYHPVNDTKYIITPEQSYRLLWTQVIVGDRTDNIPGLPGSGPVAAEKAIKDAEHEVDCANKVLELYKDRMSPEADAVKWFRENGALVYLLRAEDDSFAKHCRSLGLNL